MKKILSALLIAIVFLAGTFISLPQSQAAPEAQFSTRRPVWQFLDTSGDGTGTIDATGNYTTATAFYIQPSAASVYVLDKLIVLIEDSTVITTGYYGGITLTNGVAIRRVSGSEVITLTNRANLTDGQDWQQFCEVSQTAYASTGNTLQAICDLPDVQLNGDRSETFEFVLQDDFSGLDGQHFVVQGYQQ